MTEADKDESVQAILLTTAGEVSVPGLDIAAIRAGADPVEFAAALVELLHLFAAQTNCHSGAGRRPRRRLCTRGRGRLCGRRSPGTDRLAGGERRDMADDRSGAARAPHRRPPRARAASGAASRSPLRGPARLDWCKPSSLPRRLCRPPPAGSLWRSARRKPTAWVGLPLPVRVDAIRRRPRRLTRPICINVQGDKIVTTTVALLGVGKMGAAFIDRWRSAGREGRARNRTCRPTSSR